MAKWLIFDTETTGLWDNTVKSLDKQPEIFEWFSVVLDTETFEIDNELHLFFKPTKSMDKGASKATGKKDEDLKDYPPFRSGAEQICSVIEYQDVVLAHNLQYDVTVTDFEFKRLGLFVNWPDKVCTVEKTEWIEGYRQSLTNLHKLLFDEDFGGKHEAKNDVLALARCVIELLKRNWI